MGCTGGDTCTALTWMSSSNVTLLEENQYPLTLKEQICRTFLGYVAFLVILHQLLGYNFRYTIYRFRSASGVQLAPNFTCYK